jgi:hypothetical protein
LVQGCHNARSSSPGEQLIFERAQTDRQREFEGPAAGLSEICGGGGPARVAAKPWEQLKGQVLLGSNEWLEEIRGKVNDRQREQPQIRALQRRRSFNEVMKAVSAVR